MDSKQINDIDEQVNTLINNIKKLQDEMEGYQNGQQAFREATGALREVATSQGELANVVKISVENLEKIDSVVVLERVGETVYEIKKMSEELDLLFDKLAEISKNLTTEINELNRQIKLSEATNTKIIENTNKKIKEMFDLAEEKMAQMMTETSEKYTKLMAAAEQRLISASIKKLQKLERTTSDMVVKTKAMEKNIEMISQKIDEGPKVKKRFFRN